MPPEVLQGREPAVTASEGELTFPNAVRELHARESEGGLGLRRPN